MRNVFTKLDIFFLTPTLKKRLDKNDKINTNR